MTLKDEVASILKNLLGPGIAKQLDNFDDPAKYPNDFLDECTYFLGQFIGDEAAKKKMEPLYKKYIK